LKRLLIATAMVAGLASAAYAAYEPSNYVSAYPLDQRQQQDFTAICRRAGDTATPRPQSARIVGRVLIIDGGDHRNVEIDHRTGDITLHCVDASFRARWIREKP
jgi:hypothetical protein